MSKFMRNPVSSFLYAVLLCSVTFAQDGVQGWTPEVMIKFKRVGGTAISTDGQLVAYTVSTPIMEEDKSEYLTHIWLVSADGKMNRQFTRGDKSCTAPSFSPDGNYLAFLSARDNEKNQVWILPLSGGEAEQVTEARSGVSSYKWSPDSRRIAYIASDPPTEAEQQDKKGKLDMKKLDRNYKYAHLHSVTTARLLSGERRFKHITAGDFHVTDFDWSPDGTSIAFEHRINPKIDEWPTTDISVVPSDSGEIKPLITFSGGDFSPRYSPDGKWLAFVSDGNHPKWARAQDLYVLATAGGEPKKLALTADRRPQIVAWAENSKAIYFAETDGTNRRVYRLAINGDSPEVLTPGPGTFSSPAISLDGKSMALIHQSPDVRPDVHLTPTKKFEPVKLSTVNADFPNYPMGKTEVIVWKSKDGLAIEGLLTYPVRHAMDRLYPLILNVHGGPAGVFTESYTARASVYPIQAFAQQGYAVLRPNPRGSSGYGKDFRFANYNDWGFGDYEDLIAGVSKVVGMGVAHPDSLCVMGWSYGGYMTSFIITKSRQFKAASVGAGVTNLFSFAGTADIPSFLPDYFGGEPWDRLETYMKHSAMFQVKGVSTPTQIIHGENDERVPLSQGLELYNALKRQGCATEMIVYPRTAHGPREPKFIQDIGERIIAWFNLHLGRKGRATGPMVGK